MTNQSKEYLHNPDVVLANSVRYEHFVVLNMQPSKADQAVAHMVRMQERLGDAASKHFVPKDYTKPAYEALPSDPIAKKDAFEQALIGVKVSSEKTVPEIDEDLARILVEQSLWDEEVASEYINKGLKDAENFANSQVVDTKYIAKGIKDLESFANSQEKTNAR